MGSYAEPQGKILNIAVAGLGRQLIMQRSAPQPNVLIQDTVTGARLARARNYNFNWDGGLDFQRSVRFGDN